MSYDRESMGLVHAQDRHVSAGDGCRRRLDAGLNSVELRKHAQCGPRAGRESSGIGGAPSAINIDHTWRTSKVPRLFRNWGHKQAPVGIGARSAYASWDWRTEGYL